MHGPALHLLVAAAYAGLALWFLKSRWLTRPAAPGLALWERGAILGALALHGAILAEMLLGTESPPVRIAVPRTGVQGGGGRL